MTTLTIIMTIIKIMTIVTTMVSLNLAVLMCLDDCIKRVDKYRVWNTGAVKTVVLR